MFKPPKGIKYGIVSKEELLEAMNNDERLMELAAKKLAAEEHIKNLREELKECKAVHKKSFWGLWKAEGDLTKAKMRKQEQDTKDSRTVQSRSWDLFKMLKFKKAKLLKLNVKVPKNTDPE